MRESIRGNQRPLEPEPFGQRTGGSQLEAIRGNQRQLEALKGHQWKPEHRNLLYKKANTCKHSACIHLRSARRRRVAASGAASNRTPTTGASRHPPEEPPYDRHTCHRTQSQGIQRRAQRHSEAPNYGFASYRLPNMGSCLIWNRSQHSPLHVPGSKCLQSLRRWVA
jgi:hypothetical protein